MLRCPQDQHTLFWVVAHGRFALSAGEFVVACKLGRIYPESMTKFKQRLSVCSLHRV